MPGRYTVFGKETLAVDSVGKALASAPDKAEACFITCEGADVRWWDDETNPSTTVGHLLKSGVSMWYEGNMANLRFTAVSGTPTLTVTYYVY